MIDFLNADSYQEVWLNLIEKIDPTQLKTYS